MSYLALKTPPIREERLKACNAYGGSAGCLLKGSKAGCLAQTGRSFLQAAGCQFTLSLASINTIQDSVVLLHGPLGCGVGTSMVANGIVKINQGNRGLKQRGVVAVSTNLNEVDVISGGEQKLREAIVGVDRHLHPTAIFVVSSCVPAIIGDDIDTVVRDVQPEVSAKLLVLHCEGFKTKIQATAYDATYHAILRGLFEVDPRLLPPEPQVRTEQVEAREAAEERLRKRTVNLLNVSSMSWVDEVELTRLLNALDLEVNIYPCYAHPDDFIRTTEAALSISICPTHDDYFLSHLQELYGVPSMITTMPLGITNTRKWLLDVAGHFGKEELALRIIDSEEREVRAAIKPLIAQLKDKTAFVCAGEFRAAGTALLLEEDYGMKVLGVRAFHYDSFADDIFAQLPRQDEMNINVAPWQPFEQANLLHKLNPDVFVGHVGGNVWAAKEGFAVIPIFSPSNSYLGYKGIFEMANRLERVVRNAAFNKRIAQQVSAPYRASWYDDAPFKFIKQDGLA